MGVLLDGRFNLERQGRGRARDIESSRLTGGWNLVLSSKHNERALSELHYLDGAGGNFPVHLQFDSPVDLARFYREADTLSREKPIHIIHAHDLYAAAMALIARKAYEYKVVVDYSPVLKPLASKNGDNPEDVLPQWGSRALELLEKWVIQNVSHTIVETRTAARYLKSRYSLSAERLSVIPNCADAAIYRYDATAREIIRAQLGLAYRLIVTHAGDIVNQDMDTMITVFRNLLEQQPAAHFLSLTCTAHSVQEYLSDRLPQGTFSVVSPTAESLPAYLSVSDLGFVLPKPCSTLQALSPALFAQFLNCGVPVIISSDVGDFSNLVRHKMIGNILKDFMVSNNFIRAVVRSRDEMAQRCIQEGRSLTWQHQQDISKYVF